ncbi:HNH endonuclease [Tumebacillus flagellatus]|uniref:HTH cro/C1-type domain-containing protein n=1 Tax=Tumebacillus flagellatus TaxID=1157490 RepID=A0A074LMD8_9BACL|nr:HNH endonuclease [Tumebacillus flagellatus]KEO83266.1 hypothetical protein EL26_11285 [Tumebacillus flagellatus]
MSTLGQKIRELRMRLGLTQSDLAAGLITPSMVSQIEHDKANSSYKVLEAIATKLEVSIEYFLSVHQPKEEETILSKLLRLYASFETCLPRHLLQDKSFLLSVFMWRQKKEVATCKVSVSEEVSREVKPRARRKPVVRNRMDLMVEKEKERLFVNPEPQLTDPKLGRRRSNKFREFVKYIYGFACAVCGSALRDHSGNPEVESAHFYPKSMHGSDDVRNGICLCRNHHWAFDAGLFSISNNYEIMIGKDLPPEPAYDVIRKWAGKRIRLPKELIFRPHRLFMEAHRTWIGLQP